VTSSNTSRGQIVAATNFLSFFEVLCASALLFLVTDVFGLQADKGFTIIGSLTLFVTIAIGFQFFDYFTRFIAMILSKLHFKTELDGVENIPGDNPAIFVCTHTAWNDTLLLLGAQRRRMRFFIQQEMDHGHPWVKRLYRMLRVVFITEIEPLQNNEDCLNNIKRTLKRGISVCIFVENQDLLSEIDKLKQSYSFQEILDETGGCSIIPVVIEKGEKHSQAAFFTRFLNKFRVPAAVSFG
jgi:acyl-[acyl-carrier-protein]-phospholipid O-acyltransferase / long-chain-fatty-acid--[acyl-carrier-protein] ligase